MIAAQSLLTLAAEGPADRIPAPHIEYAQLAPTLIVVGSTLVLAQSPMLILATFLGALVGAFAGDTAWFLTGRRFGYRVLDSLCRISLSPDTCVRRASGFFEKRGVKLLLVF